MRPLAPALLTAFALALAACGGTRDRPAGMSNNRAGSNSTNNNTNNTSGPNVTPDHPALCTSACATPSEGPCAAADAAACTNRCAASTNGVSSACAACLLGESGYAGQECTCYGTGCTLCPFAPDDTVCNSAGPEETCSAAEEICDGFEAAEILGGPCEAACLDDAENPPNLEPTFRDRCATLCANRPAACAAASESDCVSACLTQADASGGACGLCLIERAGWAGDACTCYGTGCTLCGFGPQPTACSGAAPEDTCAAADETCDGLELPAAADECAEYCL